MFYVAEALLFEKGMQFRQHFGVHDVLWRAICQVRSDELWRLTDYAVTTRYLGDWEPIDEAECKQAVSLAQEV